MPRTKPMNVKPVTKEVRKASTKRLIGYVFRYYPWQFALVSLSILISTIASASGSYFAGAILVNQYLTPTIKDGVAFNWDSFTLTIIVMAAIYGLGILASYLYNYLMAYIAQGVQKKIRDELFSHMQTLPVSYFDSRTHGDVMSVYTNDVDALREMLARALPMVVNALMMMVVCFFFMIFTDLLLTAIVLAFSIVIFFPNPLCNQDVGQELRGAAD
jgi:ATP-binding cassette subfamily B multidrug efflux pump